MATNKKIFAGEEVGFSNTVMVAIALPCINLVSVLLLWITGWKVFMFTFWIGVVSMNVLLALKTATFLDISEEVEDKFYKMLDVIIEKGMAHMEVYSSHLSALLLSIISMGIYWIVQGWSWGLLLIPLSVALLFSCATFDFYSNLIDAIKENRLSLSIEEEYGNS